MIIKLDQFYFWMPSDTEAAAKKYRELYQRKWSNDYNTFTIALFNLTSKLTVVNSIARKEYVVLQNCKTFTNNK